MKSLTHELLLEIILYDPVTGIFTWKTARPKIRIGQKAGYLHHRGYVNMEIYGKHYTAHRLAWFYMTGRWPADQIDHKNRNRADNRFENLREANNGQQQANSTSQNKTGFRGVTYHPRLKDNPYEAKIKKDGKVKSLGCYPTPQEAHAVYMTVAQEIHGEFLLPNHDAVAATS